MSPKRPVPLTPYCATYTRAMDIIGRRWTGAIIRSILGGKGRFGEILAAIPGLSDRLLSERLKELEGEGIIQRTVTPSHPVRIEYKLTDKGEALAAVVRAVAEWAETWVADPTTESVGASL